MYHRILIRPLAINKIATIVIIIIVGILHLLSDNGIYWKEISILLKIKKRNKKANNNFLHFADRWNSFAC